MIRIMGYFWMTFTSAMCGGFAFYNLLQTGAPLMGLVLFASGAMFVGGWILIAEELEND
jgi:hypothetical protein|tara:strand:+ start:570 stop:746 length:177 start_codon:yes stop_codon:yes gene_type:complete